jgi:hypothetical protein
MFFFCAQMFASWISPIHSVDGRSAPMSAHIASVAFVGIEALIDDVQAQIANGAAGFSCVGLAD